MENIKETIFKFLRLDNLIESVSGYFETRVDLIKMEIREELVKVISHGLMIGVLFLLALLFLVFFSFGLANYINVYYKDPYAGYWVVACVYGLPGLVIALFHKKISHFFESYLMDQIKRKER